MSRNTSFVGFGIFGGPNGAVTPILLDTLLFLDQRATFFLEQELISRNPHITYRISAEGHEAALLGANQEDRGDQRATMLKAIRDVLDITGERTSLFLDRNNADVSAATGSARFAGLHIVHWTHRAPRFSSQSPEAAATHILEVIKPGDILVIDGLQVGGRVKVDFKRAALMERVIARLRTSGHSLCLVSEVRGQTRTTAS